MLSLLSRDRRTRQPRWEQHCLVWNKLLSGFIDCGTTVRETQKPVQGLQTSGLEKQEAWGKNPSYKQAAIR